MHRFSFGLARTFKTAAILVAAAGGLLLSGSGAGAASAESVAAQATAASGNAEARTGTLPTGKAVTAHLYNQPPQPNFNPEERAAFQAALSKSHRSGPTNLPRAGMTASGPLGPEVPNPRAASANPTNFFFANKLVAPSGATFSDVDEPSGDLSGKYRFQTGNWYAALSTNSGVNWSYVNPFTMFGSGFCCDQVSVYDPGRSAWFWLLQYGDHIVIANSTNLTNWCSYTFTAGQLGYANGEIDYNDLGITTNYLYMVSNVFPAGGGQGSVIVRLPIDGMLACGNIGFNYFSALDSFTWKPVSGATDVLYWGTNWLGTLGSSFRIFKWPENTTTISWFDRTLGTTFSFYTRNSGQNCGSQDGVVTNWCQFADSRVLGGARYSDPNGVAKLVFSFNAGQGGPFNLPFPYDERVYFQEYDLAYAGSDRFFGTWGAFAFMSMATDARGHIGMTTLWGGGTGATHYYPGGAIVLQDDVTPGQPWTYAYHLWGAGNVCLDSGIYRTGDYTTTRTFRPTNLAFVGYDFSLSSNAGACNTGAPVIAVEVEFGRNRDWNGAIGRWSQ